MPKCGVIFASFFCIWLYLGKLSEQAALKGPHVIYRQKVEAI